MLEQDILDRMVQGLAPLLPVVRQRVEDDVRREILKHAPSEIVTFCAPSGRKYKPKVSLDYVKALWCFLWDKALDGEHLDSLVSMPIARAAEKAFAEALAARTTAEHIAVPLLREGDSPLGDETRIIIYNETRWLQKELESAIDLSGGDLLKAKLADVTIDQISNFFLHTAAGSAVLAAFVKVAGTVTGKAVILAAIKAALSSVALKTAAVVLLKKFGLLLFVKIAIVKILGIIAPKVLAMKIPIIGFVFAALLIAFIKHDIETLPQKLAEKVPGQIGDQLARDWPSISRQLAGQTMFVTARQEIRKRRRRRVMIRVLLGTLFVLAAIVLFVF
jgi:hypothetical protein